MNEALLIQELIGLVGFKNSTIPAYAIVDADNQTSDSSLFFQGGNALVTIKNIHETQENVDISDEDFNTYLTDLQSRAIVEFCSKVVLGKERFIEQNVLLPYEQSFKNTYEAADFIGISITPCLNQDVLISINTVTASFNKAITLPVKLINSETGTVIESEDVITVDRDAVRKRVNWKFSLTTNRTGGSYRIGYFASDLDGAKPYKRDHDLSSAYSSNMNIEFIKSSLDGYRIDITSETSINQPYGLNIEYSINSDFTQKFIQNKYSLAKGIQLQMSEMIIELVLNSTRSNRDERILKEIRNIANFNLNDPTVGIRKRLEDQVLSVRKMFWPEHKIMRGTLS